MFKIGDKFTGKYPSAADIWCNQNNAMIVKLDSDEYEIVAIPDSTTDEIASQKRAQRNALLEATDKYTSVPDLPITDEVREQYKEYRQYLRDIPTNPAFPNVEILTFDAWVESQSETSETVAENKEA